MDRVVDQPALEVRVDDVRDAVDELDEFALRESPIEEREHLENSRERVGRLNVERAGQQEYQGSLARDNTHHAVGCPVARREHQHVWVAAPLGQADHQLTHIVVVLHARHNHVEKDHQLLVVGRLDRLVHAACPVRQLGVGVEAAPL